MSDILNYIRNSITITEVTREMFCLFTKIMFKNSDQISFCEGQHFKVNYTL